MNAELEKPKTKKSGLINNSIGQKKSNYSEGFVIQDNRSNSSNGNLVTQLQKAKGRYRISKNTANLRNDDDGHTVNTTLSEGDIVSVISKGDRESNFRAGFIKNEHSWVRTSEGTNGWIEDSKLERSEASSSSGIGIQPLEIHLYGHEESKKEKFEPSGVEWENADGLKIWIDRGEAFIENGNSVGNVQFKAKDDTIYISGINSDIAGVGSVLIESVLDSHEGYKYAGASAIVGSFGYWKKLGLDIDDRMIIDMKGMSRDKMHKANEALKIKNLSENMRRISANKKPLYGFNDHIPFAEFRDHVLEEIHKKGWAKS